MVNLEENLSNMTSTKFPKYRTIWQYRYDLYITVPVYTGTVGMVPVPVQFIHWTNKNFS